jgi:hypothetical protein
MAAISGQCKSASNSDKSPVKQLRRWVRDGPIGELSPRPQAPFRTCQTVLLLRHRTSVARATVPIMSEVGLGGKPASGTPATKVEVMSDDNNEVKATIAQLQRQGITQPPLRLVAARREREPLHRARSIRDKHPQRALQAQAINGYALLHKRSAPASYSSDFLAGPHQLQVFDSHIARNMPTIQG